MFTHYCLKMKRRPCASLLRCLIIDVCCWRHIASRIKRHRDSNQKAYIGFNLLENVNYIVLSERYVPDYSWPTPSHCLFFIQLNNFSTFRSFQRIMYILKCGIHWSLWLYLEIYQIGAASTTIFGASEWLNLCYEFVASRILILAWCFLLSKLVNLVENYSWLIVWFSAQCQNHILLLQLWIQGS